MMLVILSPHERVPEPILAMADIVIQGGKVLKDSGARK